jgi:hypothetical protein
MRQEVRPIPVRRMQNEIGEAFGNQGCDLGKVGVPAFDVLLHEFVDGAVQAFGRRG